jgi:hypothetical protein
LKALTYRDYQMETDDRECVSFGHVCLWKDQGPE